MGFAATSEKSNGRSISDVAETKPPRARRVMRSADELEAVLKVNPRDDDPGFDAVSKFQYWLGHYYLVYRGKPDTSSGLVGAFRDGIGRALIEHSLTRLEKRLRSFRRRYEEYQPLPEIDSEDISDEQIYSLSQYQRPFVIRGKIRNWRAVKEFTPEFLRANYGNVKIPINHGKKRASDDKTKPTDYREYYKIRYATVSDLIDSAVSGGDLQALSVEDLLHRDNDYLIKNFLELDKIREWSGLTHAKSFLHKKLRVGLIGSLQLFVASSTGYTTWHCAPAHNFFLQIYGKKYWTFADTAYTVGMSPVIKTSQQYQGSLVDSRESLADCVSRGFSLYPYVPKFDITLEPGDLLFNPQYCWHSVKTEGTGATIGIGVRSVSAPNLNSPAYQMLRLLDWESYRIIKASANQGRLKDDDLVNRIFEYVDPENRQFSSKHVDKVEAEATVRPIRSETQHVDGVV
jgi:hypothetical protein